MKEVCELMGGVFIDASNFGFTRQNYAAPKFALTDNTPDGSIFHPNATGQEILGQCIAAAVREKAVGYVNWLINRGNNVCYFYCNRQYPFRLKEQYGIAEKE